MDLGTMVRRSVEGDWQAFSELVSRYQNLAFGAAFTMLGDFQLAEDATQEAFVAAYFDLHKLRSPEAFAVWLRSVVRHECNRILRRPQHTLVPWEHAGDVAAPAQGPPEQIEAKELRDGVVDAINALPQGQREVIALYYLHDRSQRDIADFLGIPATTVNNRLHAARKQLKRRLVTMAEETMRGHALSKDFVHKVGKLVEVRGPIVEAQFALDQLPPLLTVLTVSDGGRNMEINVHVAQHLGNGMARCIAVTPTERLAPGMGVVSTGALVERAVDEATLRHLLELLGSSGEGTETRVIETGIKSIDLLSPYPSGGKVGVLGPMGVGKMVLIQEVMHNVAARGDAVSLFTFFRPGAEISLLQQAFANEDMPTSTSAEAILLSAENPLEPVADTDVFDAVTVMSLDRAINHLWPAIDPLRSTSRVLDQAIVGGEHRKVEQSVRELLQQYRELDERIKQAALYSLSREDKLVIARARKLQRFFTQPFFVAEPYTKRLGQYVTRQETIRGCAGILEGEYDALPEEAFLWCGTIDQVVEKAGMLVRSE